MFHYHIFGIDIASEIELPGMGIGQGTPALYIRRAAALLPPVETRNARRWLGGSADDVLLHFANLGTFRVIAGREVICESPAQVDERFLVQVLTGPALAIALLQRGRSVFHAAVLQMGDGAVAMMARKGQGKSTLAAALHRRGHSLLSDDLLVLAPQGEGLICYPGAPRLKLWPDSALACGFQPEHYPTIGGSIPKHIMPCADGFSLEPLPLQRVYVLGRGDQIAIERLQGSAALWEIAPHWYGALFQGELLPILGAGEQLRQCAALLQNAPVYTLKRPVDLALLPETTNLLAAHNLAAHSVRGQV